ncbi:MAG: peptidylprolyl isomerase [Desulfomonilia bacterium]|nr:peptidylprolyl isomerase [Desulfomonilia bacterium]
MKRSFAAVFMVLIVVFGCSQAQKEAGGTPGGITDPDVVAIIGDDVVYGKDIEMVLAQMPEQIQKRYTPSQLRREVLEGFISMKMLAHEAMKRGIDQDEEVKHKLAYVVEQFLAKQMELELRKSITLGDAEIEQYFVQNRERYMTAERIRARHILVDSEERARELLREIRSGADFAELAQRVSSCPSASTGGDLGWFSKGKMDPVFEEAAFALGNGEVSEVVKSGSGYHLIKLEDRKPARERTLDQVRTSIQRTLEKEVLQKSIDELRENLRSEMGVMVNEGYFHAFSGEPASGRGKEETPDAP